jgi:predicted nucleic acid-binding protein
MTRAVFDSSVLISAFLRPGGLSDELLALATRGEFQLVLAPEIILET